MCLERAHDYAKRIPMAFDKWVEFGYPNSDPTIDRDVNQKTDQAINAILPKVFRCTECGKYRLIQSLDKEIDAAFFICLENPDQVSDNPPRVTQGQIQRCQIVFRPTICLTPRQALIVQFTSPMI